MNIVICDDETICIKQVSDILAEILQPHNIPYNVKNFSSGKSCLEYLATNSVDLVFMDIFLKDSQGTDLAMKLRRQGHTFKLIFLTTSNEFAQESFQAKASYYLLKPATKAKVTEALEAAGVLHKGSDLEIIANGVKVNLQQEKIILVESQGKPCLIHTTTETFKTYTSFQALTEKLNFPPFLLVNKGLLINLNHVQKLEDNCFFLNNDYQAHIKVHGIKALKTQYAKWLLDNI